MLILTLLFICLQLPRADFNCQRTLNSESWGAKMVHIAVLVAVITIKHKL